MEKIDIVGKINAWGERFNTGFDQKTEQVLGKRVINMVAAVNEIAAEAYDIFPITATTGATAVGLMGAGAINSPELSLLGVGVGAATVGTLFLEGLLGTPVAGEEEGTIFTG